MVKYCVASDTHGGRSLPTEAWLLTSSRVRYEPARAVVSRPRMAPADTAAALVYQVREDHTLLQTLSLDDMDSLLEIGQRSVALPGGCAQLRLRKTYRAHGGLALMDPVGSLAPQFDQRMMRENKQCTPAG